MRRKIGIAATSAIVLAAALSAIHFMAFDTSGGIDCSVACQQTGAGARDELIAEHLVGGVPPLTDTAHQTILARNAYVICFNCLARIPEWVAYHVTPDYLNVPDREGEYDEFHPDPDISGEARDADYDGWWTERGYDRGHLAPYAIAGGDRDGDGSYAVFPFDDPSNDLEDARTLCEINYMSNIAPQHWKFNRSGGLWYELERKLQDEWVETDQRDLWVIAGCVLGEGKLEGIGDDGDILVPPMFYKIVIEEQTSSKVLAFLFPHQRVAHGEIEDFLVSIDVIESLTGFDFFPNLEEHLESEIEDRDTSENWSAF